MTHFFVAPTFFDRFFLLEKKKKKSIFETWAMSLKDPDFSRRKTVADELSFGGMSSGHVVHDKLLPRTRNKDPPPPARCLSSWCWPTGCSSVSRPCLVRGVSTSGSPFPVGGFDENPLTLRTSFPFPLQKVLERLHFSGLYYKLTVLDISTIQL